MANLTATGTELNIQITVWVGDCTQTTPCFQGLAPTENFRAILLLAGFGGLADLEVKFQKHV